MSQSMFPRNFISCDISKLPNFQVISVLQKYEKQSTFAPCIKSAPEGRQPSKPDATVAKRCGCSIKKSLYHERVQLLQAAGKATDTLDAYDYQNLKV